MLTCTESAGSLVPWGLTLKCPEIYYDQHVIENAVIGAGDKAKCKHIPAYSQGSFSSQVAAWDSSVIIPMDSPYCPQLHSAMCLCAWCLLCFLDQKVPGFMGMTIYFWWHLNLITSHEDLTWCLGKAKKIVCSVVLPFRYLALLTGKQ